MPTSASDGSARSAVIHRRTNVSSASGAEIDAVVDYLRQRELESMCFPSIGKSHLKGVAEKLLEVKSVL